MLADWRDAGQVAIPTFAVTRVLLRGPQPCCPKGLASGSAEVSMSRELTGMEPDRRGGWWTLWPLPVASPASWAWGTLSGKTPAGEPDRGGSSLSAGGIFSFVTMVGGMVYRELAALLTPLEAAQTHGKTIFS